MKQVLSRVSGQLREGTADNASFFPQLKLRTRFLGIFRHCLGNR